MSAVEKLKRCIESFTHTNMYVGERLWWSGVVGLLSLCGVWAYVFVQVYVFPQNLDARDWVVAVILVFVVATFLVMVFGRKRRIYAEPLEKPKFLAASRAGQRFLDRAVGGIWFFNILGILIAAIEVAYIIQFIGSLVRPSG